MAAVGAFLAAVVVVDLFAVDLLVVERVAGVLAAVALFDAVFATAVFRAADDVPELVLLALAFLAAGAFAVVFFLVADALAVVVLLAADFFAAVFDVADFLA
ncbi:MAG: hypothetical protein WKF54_11670, partial [Nocardioidaceae bacterium]